MEPQRASIVLIIAHLNGQIWANLCFEILKKIGYLYTSRDRRQSLAIVLSALDIKDIEKELTRFNSKTCDYDKFKVYIKKKNETNHLLFEKMISKTFGKDTTIISGDWSQGACH